jgi:hypothetical protein
MSAEHATPGDVALSITRRASGSWEDFEANNSTVFEPIFKPETVATPSFENDADTFWPLSVSLA